jgi:hypothetical protein
MEPSAGPINITITLLGTTAAGKTAYMLGVYNVMRLGVGSFTLTCTDKDHDLRLDQAWQKLLAPKDPKDRWPESTTKPTVYPFRLMYALRHPIAEFSWLDYRGGAMTTTTDKSAEGELEKLYDHLGRSDTVVICVSGEHLDQKNRVLYAQAKAEVGRINTLFSDFAPRAKVLPAVVIMLTKFDRCAHRDPEELVAELQSMFRPFFEKDSGWTVLICPVTLGMELADNLETGMIDPLNVDVPVAFGVFCALQKRYRELDTAACAAAARERDIRRKYDDNRTTADRLANSYKGIGKLWYRQTLAEKTAARRQLAAQLAAAAEAAKVPVKLRDAVAENMQLLLDRLTASNLSFFESGVRMTYQKK